MNEKLKDENRLFNEDGYYSNRGHELADLLDGVIEKFYKKYPNADANDVISITCRAGHLKAAGIHMKRRIERLQEEEKNS